jgi:hypothetical protein
MPDGLSEQDRQTKLALEQLKRDIYAAANESGQLAPSDVQRLKQTLATLNEVRTDSLEGIYAEIERFLNR